MRHAIALGIIAGILLTIVGCQTPAILDPHVAPGQFNPNTDVRCNGGGWCVAEVQECGPETPGCSVPDSCCATGVQPDTYGDHGRVTRQRHR